MRNYHARWYCGRATTESGISSSTRGAGACRQASDDPTARSARAVPEGSPVPVVRGRSLPAGRSLRHRPTARRHLARRRRARRSPSGGGRRRRGHRHRLPHDDRQPRLPRGRCRHLLFGLAGRSQGRRGGVRAGRQPDPPAPRDHRPGPGGHHLPARGDAAPHPLAHRGEGRDRPGPGAAPLGRLRGLDHPGLGGVGPGPGVDGHRGPEGRSRPGQPGLCGCRPGRAGLGRAHRRAARRRHHHRLRGQLLVPHPAQRGHGGRRLPRLPRRGPPGPSDRADRGHQPRRASRRRDGTQSFGRHPRGHPPHHRVGGPGSHRGRRRCAVAGQRR